MALQHLRNCVVTRSALDTDASKLHLQSKWHVLPHIYPSGSNCGATGTPQIHTRVYPKVTCPGNQKQVTSCPVDISPLKSSARLKSIERESQHGAGMALAIQTLACFILINHIDMPNIQLQFCCQKKLRAAAIWGFLVTLLPCSCLAGGAFTDLNAHY